MKVTNRVALFAATLLIGAPALAKVPVEVSLPQQAKLGQTVTVSVKTDPKTKCKIEAQDAGMTQSLKLLDKTADSSGKARWKFEIPKSYKANEMPVTITVDKNGEQDKAIKTINIEK